MVAILYDKYNLGQSESKLIDTVAQEISIDLSLDPNTYAPAFAKVYGNVKNSKNIPIEKALIQIMSPDFTPLMYTLTDSMGNYLFSNVQPGSYTIFCTATGYKIQEGIPFSIVNSQEIERNFILDGELEMTLGVIAGDLLNLTTNSPIGGAVISLFKGTSTDPDNLIGVTFTNEYGQFTFRDLPKGEYTVEAKTLGYSSIIVNTTISTDGQIVPMKLTVSYNNVYQSTISGTITDNNNYPIYRADVILYRVNVPSQNLARTFNSSNETLTPIAFTKTNHNGIYLFIYVPPGTYKIKANELEIRTITI